MPRVAPDQGVRELPLETCDLEPVALEVDLLGPGRTQVLAVGTEDGDLRLEHLDALLGGLGRRTTNVWPQKAHGLSVDRFISKMVNRL